VNQDNKRILIGYLLFSTASGISSSYNHAILKELLKQYKDKISIENNHDFLPKVAITNTDHKETED
ncbi:9637_t:CDS:2, partial [Rhizophagus irregularis]